MTDFHKPSNLPREARRFIADHRKQFMWTGVALVVLGLLGIIFPLFFSIITKVMIGWFFLIGGAITLYHAFWAKGWESALISGIIGVLYIALGVYMAFFPLTGLIGLTAIMSIAFLVQGGAEMAIAMRRRPRRGWGWMAVSAASSGIMGILLLLGLPGTAVWALGLFVGVNLLTTGLSFIAVARAVE